MAARITWKGGIRSKFRSFRGNRLSPNGVTSANHLAYVGDSDRSLAVKRGFEGSQSSDGRKSATGGRALRSGRPAVGHALGHGVPWWPDLSPCVTVAYRSC